MLPRRSGATRKIWISKAGPPEVIVAKKPPIFERTAGQMCIRVGAIL